MLHSQGKEVQLVRLVSGIRKNVLLHDSPTLLRKSRTSEAQTFALHPLDFQQLVVQNIFVRGWGRDCFQTRRQGCSNSSCGSGEWASFEPSARTCGIQLLTARQVLSMTCVSKQVFGCHAAYCYHKIHKICIAPLECSGQMPQKPMAWKSCKKNMF